MFSSPLMIAQTLAASGGELTGATLSGSNNYLKFAMALKTPVKYKVFTLRAPDRVVVDLSGTELKGKLKQGSHDRPPLQGIRYAQRQDGTLRVVLDLSSPVAVDSSMNPDGKGGHILSILLKSDQPAAASPRPAPALAANRSTSTSREKKFVVVIDPGHGGRDPGAIGVNGTMEKTVVLEVGRKLKSLIDRKPGMQAILTRSNDSFVPLRQRIDIARRHNADLFVSVHADANPSSRVRGSTVYILSENGASSEAARLLAESENSYELRLGDVRLTGSDAKVASILLDLSQSATMDRSLEVAKSTLSELSRINNPLRKKVESAGFVVLKAPDIPSMLVETAFISNPTEEKRLRTADYQQRLAEAMFRGIHRYQLAHAQFNENSISPEPETLASATSDERIEPEALGNIGQEDHIVQNGDSLSVIAEHYGVSVSDLKRENALRSNTIRTGQKLKIPPTNT